MKKRVTILGEAFDEASKKFCIGQITHEQYDEVIRSFMLAKKIYEFGLPKRILKCLECEEMIVVTDKGWETDCLCASCVDALFAYINEEDYEEY